MNERRNRPNARLAWEKMKGPLGGSSTSRRTALSNFQRANFAQQSEESPTYLLTVAWYKQCFSDKLKTLRWKVFGKALGCSPKEDASLNAILGAFCNLSVSSGTSVFDATEMIALGWSTDEVRWRHWRISSEELADWNLAVCMQKNLAPFRNSLTLGLFLRNSFGLSRRTC